MDIFNSAPRHKRGHVHRHYASRHHKSVKSNIPPYFKDQSVPIILYAYTRPIASKHFNYKHVLRDLNIDDFKSKPVQVPHSYIIRLATL